MTICNFCHAQLPNHVSFCGSCGRSQVQAEPMGATQPFVDVAATIVDTSDADRGARLENLPTAQLSSDTVLVANDLVTEPAYQASDLPTMIVERPLAGQTEEEEEDEKKRRLLLFGLAAPVLGAALLPDGNSNTPLVSPDQLHANPALHGPALPSGAPAPGSGGPATLPNTPAMQSLPANISPTFPNPLPAGNTPPLPGNPLGSPAGNPYPSGSGTAGGASGCMPWLIVLIATLLVLGSIFGLSVTVFAPAITLNGGQNVSLGGTLQLKGNGFLPNTNIQLALDNNLPLYIVSAPTNHSTIAYFSVLTIADTQSTAVPYTQYAPNTLISTSTGSFSAQVNVDTAWKLGRHAVHATETVSGRNANLTFYVTATAPTSPTASPTAKAKAKATGTATASPTQNPQNAQAQLASVSPANVSLGPVAEGSTQAVSSSVLLQTSGNGVINWSVVSDQQWLQLGASTGQIQAPAAQSITISANPGNLAAGTYQGTITFHSQQSNMTVTLFVSLTVQAGCVRVSPTVLTFTGFAYQNPSDQTVQLADCSLGGSWSSAVATSSGGNWLAITPANGTLNAGGTENVTVSILGRADNLGAGNYTGTITFINGPVRTAVSVTAVLIPPPLIIVTPSALTSYNNCTSSRASYTCNIVVGNRSNQSPAAWSSTPNGTSGIGITPASGTIPAGQRVVVVLTFPNNDCGNTLTVTFNGPGNSVPVSWYCPPPIQ